MSIKRILAIGLIFALAAAGWCILGSATRMRSYLFERTLGGKVETLWGGRLVQQAPSVAVKIPGSEQVRWIMPSANTIRVRLDTDYRKKGLVWYPTYTCAFEGSYTIANTDETAQKARIHFDFPSAEGTYDDFSVRLDDLKLVAPVRTDEGITEIVEIAAGASRTFTVTYRTRGLSEWTYQPDRQTGRVQGLDLQVETGFRDVDYTDGGLSPTQVEYTGEGARLSWTASDLITSQHIGIIVPEKLNPGPLTSRITFFAPVCLLFFFILTATIGIVRGIGIHPMHYLFVAAGFFAFHLLLAYTAGLVDIHVAFLVSAVVSVVLVTSYLRAALGPRFPWRTAVAGQLFFLVLFSYSFFFQGYTGLTVAIGSVVTLAVLMKVTAAVNWEEVFRKPARPPAVPPPLQAGLCP